MKTRAGILCAALALLLAGLGFDAVQEVRLLQHERSSETLKTHGEDLDREIRARARELTRGGSTPSALTRRPVAGEGSSPSGSKRSGAPGESSGLPVDSIRVIAANATLRSQYTQMIRDSLDLQWNLLFRSLGLAPDKLEAFKDALAGRQTEDVQVAQAALEQNLDPASPLMQAYRNQLDKGYKADIIAAIGPANFPAYKDYMLDSGVASTVLSVAGNMLTTPLTNDQGLQLTKALANASQRNANGGVIWDTIDLDRALANAQPILTSDQMTVLNAILVKQQVNDQLNVLK